MIRRLRLTDFKNFRDATLELGPLTVLVGANASGKSNLRDAFRFLHGIGRGYSLADILGETYGEGGERVWTGIRGGAREIARHGAETFGLEVDLCIIMPEEGSTQYSLVANPGAGALEARVVAERLFTSFQRDLCVYAHPSGKGDPLVTQSDIPGLLSGDFFLSRGLDYPLMDDPYMPHDGPKTAYLTQRALASMRFFDWDPQAMRAPSQVGQDVLGDRGQNLSSVLKAICDEPGQKEALTEWLRVLTPMDVRDLEFPTDFAGRTLVHLVEPKGRRVSAHSASGGTLRFLALLAALMGPKAARFNVIEEIENGLHPTRLDLLVELLERQAAPDKQVVVTTHSPQLLRLLSPETMQHASLVYRLKDEGEGRIRRILDLPEAAAILDEHDPAWLFESGWLETTALFARDDDEARETPQPEPEPAAE